MQVFIGSPFKGLEPVRQELHDALEAEYDVLRMEDFGSQEVDALEACLRHVEDADVYVLLFGSLYGTCLPNSDYSYTYLEYDRAEQTGTPVLAYAQKLTLGTERDAHSADFLKEVKSSHLLEFSEFESGAELVALVQRDLTSLRERLARPKFRKSAPIADEGAYFFGAARQKVLTGAPFPVTLVDAGALGDKKYRPTKRGRLGNKVESIKRVAGETGALVQIFNDFPIKQNADLVELRAAQVNANAKLIVIFIAKETAIGVLDLFASAAGERAVFHGEWVVLDEWSGYTEEFSEADLNSCELRADVLEFIETQIVRHLAEQLR